MRLHIQRVTPTGLQLMQLVLYLTCRGKADVHSFPKQENLHTGDSRHYYELRPVCSTVICKQKTQRLCQKGEFQWLLSFNKHWRRVRYFANIAYYCCYWDKVLCSPGWPPSCYYVATDDLELLIPLPLLQNDRRASHTQFMWCWGWNTKLQDIGQVLYELLCPMSDKHQL